MKILYTLLSFITVITYTPLVYSFVPPIEPGDRGCENRSQCPGGGSK